MVECTRCDRYFSSSYALSRHLRDSSLHNICDDCALDFATWKGLKEHWVQSPYHNYCQRCNEHFDDDDELEWHMEDTHPYCTTCRKAFQDEYGLEEHFRQSSIHYYCVDCRRHFLSASNLNSHLNSSIHRPKDVHCPFRGCGQAFVSNSALILHLEAGSCPSRVNRNTVNDYVRQIDRNHVITDPSRLITGGSAGRTVTYQASSAAWNGHAYECYLCHRDFGTLSGLNKHLASPRHQEKYYLCPLTSCHERFSALSALWQHVESEKCGVSRFRPVQDALDALTRRVGRIAL